MTPAQALQSAYLPAARMLNYGWESRYRLASRRASSPTSSRSPAIRCSDITEMERVRFVMKGGVIARSDLPAPMPNIVSSSNPVR